MLLLLLPLFQLLLVLRLLPFELWPHYCHLWMDAGSSLPPFRPPGMASQSFSIVVQWSSLPPFRPPGMASQSFSIVVQLLPHQLWQPELVP